jgi:hypothetical protein
VIDSGVVPTLVLILRTARLEIKREACRALSNATTEGTRKTTALAAEVAIGCNQTL